MKLIYSITDSVALAIAGVALLVLVCAALCMTKSATLFCSRFLDDAFRKAGMKIVETEDK